MYLKKVNNEVYSWHEDKDGSLVKVDTIILGVFNQVCPKYQIQEISIPLQYLEKSMCGEVDFLPADKHQGFLQIDTIILGVCGQACPNYLK